MHFFLKHGMITIPSFSEVCVKMESKNLAEILQIRTFFPCFLYTVLGSVG